MCSWNRQTWLRTFAVYFFDKIYFPNVISGDKITECYGQFLRFIQFVPFTGIYNFKCWPSVDRRVNHLRIQIRMYLWTICEAASRCLYSYDTVNCEAIVKTSKCHRRCTSNGRSSVCIMACNIYGVSAIQKKIHRFGANSHRYTRRRKIHKKKVNKKWRTKTPQQPSIRQIIR